MLKTKTIGKYKYKKFIKNLKYIIEESKKLI